MITNKSLQNNLESRFQEVDEKLTQLSGQVSDCSKSVADNSEKLDNIVAYGLESGFRETNEKLTQLSREISGCEKRIAEISDKLNDLAASHQEIAASLRKLMDMAENIDNSTSRIGTANLPEMLKETQRARRNSEEAVWAAVFNNSISGCDWLKNRSFSPGRWALGYPALYTVFRILNDIRPRKILELGLGQSTRLISQYADSDDTIEHYIVENNSDWKEFFCSAFCPSPQTRFVMLPLQLVEYKEAAEVRSYARFAETFAGQKFDFICVDAPLGADMKTYARIDVLTILPDCLADTFAIVFDDAGRSGEKSTVKEIERILTEAKISYEKGTYNGQKSSVVICSEDIKFLCTL